MKKCIKCYVNKKLDMFDLGRNVCKKCRYEQKCALPKVKYEVVKEDKCCSKCKTLKPYIEFNVDSTRISGLHPQCNVCRASNNKTLYVKKSESIKVKSKIYYNKIKNTPEFSEKRRQYQNNKEKTNPAFKLQRRLRNRLYYALFNKTWKKGTHFSEYIGCSLEELIIHLELQFTEGMTWSNYGRNGWHMDHVTPLSSSQTELDMYKLSHYTNLKPMWERDNIVKSDILTYNIKQISHEDSLPFILNIHYAKAVPSISYAYGLFRQDILVGVCTYGTPFSPGLRDILPNQILELNRLVLKDNLKNEASRLISASLKLLPKNKIIISFADPSQGHIGTVYKACNFEYYGLTFKRNNMIIENSNNHSYTNAMLIKNDESIEYTYEPRTQKHRFITYTGSKGFKKFAKNLIKTKYLK